jgi:hypothetical protein
VLALWSQLTGEVELDLDEDWPTGTHRPSYVVTTDR